MARIRSRFQPWGDGGDKAHYHDLRRGAMDDALWEEDELVSHRKVKTSQSKRKGCPGNDGKGHVYVWIPYRVWAEHRYGPDRWAWWNLSKSEIKVCCGCWKKPKSGAWRSAA